jgi:protoheme IX farnesyltransferase
LTGFRRLVLASIAATYLLVIVGAAVRAFGAGLACPDWPLCHAAPVPPAGNTLALIEWSHRAVAGITGLLILAVAGWALLRSNLPRVVRAGAMVALGLVVFQALLGAGAVLSELAQEIVTAHLATALGLLGLLIIVWIRAAVGEQRTAPPGAQRFTLLAAFTTASLFALLLFGAHVRATGSTLVFLDWPLFGGALVPDLRDPAAAAQFAHRVVAVIVFGLLALTTFAAYRLRAQGSARGSALGSRLVRLAAAGTGLYVVQVVVGAAQIWTFLNPWLVVAHVALGAAIWALLVALTVSSYYAATTAPITVPGEPERAPGSVSSASALTSAQATSAQATAVLPATFLSTVRAYVALTKPRIIELLLVTTVPAMVVAAHGIPPLTLIVATLVGGGLAAGSANAINQYLDRDIDELMARTRRRPLVTHEVEPDRALLFGCLLGVIAFAELAVLVNLLAAFLALLAIGFYVVVYTLWLKRSTPQNIVIGGAAGALPPVIGWVAVTGDIGLPALLLFTLVFYWTPPHFWALAMRIKKDYAAAGVPMLPVVRGDRETGRQIALYSLILVAITLAFFSVARMGFVYLAVAVVLGAVFVYQALAMWRDGTPERAMRLYKYSTTYLAILFAAMVVDQLIYVV